MRGGYAEDIKRGKAQIVRCFHDGWEWKANISRRECGAGKA